MAKKLNIKEKASAGVLFFMPVFKEGGGVIPVWNMGTRRTWSLP